jgi:hypothetical protein
MFDAIDEKQSGFNIVFLPQFIEKDFSEIDCSGRKQPQVV